MDRLISENKLFIGAIALLMLVGAAGCGAASGQDDGSGAADRRNR